MVVMRSFRFVPAKMVRYPIYAVCDFIVFDGAARREPRRSGERNLWQWLNPFPGIA